MKSIVKKLNKQSKRKGRQLEPSALAEVQKLLEEMPRKKELLIEALHLIQDKYHYLSAKHLVALAHELKLSSAEVYEVATFYHHFDVIKESDINLNKETLPPPITIRVCDSVTCEMSGSKKLLDELKKASMIVPDSGEAVRIQSVPCVGRCQHAPVAVVGKNPVDYASTGRVKQKVEEKAVIPEIPKYKELDEYMSSGGYKLFLDCISEKKTPEEVINELKSSGLRGLGGAGFPAGAKWDIV